jgi:tetratricopeptide (TPR) repeat protein/transcriptional regulator with XRE-family HTH domain
LNDDRVFGAGSFGVLLRRYRLASGLSQEELAQRAGLSVRALANMERGRTRRPYKRSVQLLAEAMALSELQRLDLDRASRIDACDASVPNSVETAAIAPVAEPLPAVVPSQPQAADLADPLGGRAVPRELPAPVSNFTGRAAELDQLSDLMAEGEGRALVICAVGGAAGVGKTALAVRWAHRIAEQFPDGQLYVNLRGYDPDAPMAAADGLASLLRALGVPGADIPDAVEDRARLYRSRLAGRRVLVVLDNARDGDQVRPLLPGDRGCVAVVTSRDALAGLVAIDGARRLDLDVLPLADAVALLRSLIGPRADQDPDAAAELAGLCARLPLALRIAAELVAARREASLAELVAELDAGRLDSLDAGEVRADVRAVFSWSFRQLRSDVAEAFALIGLFPGADLDVHAAAALTGTSTAQARKMLDRLRQASLLQVAGPGRYGMHDLLRAYARERAAAADADGRCRQALTRLFGYYLSAAGVAMDILYPAEAHRRPRIAQTAAAVPSMPAEADARAWLDRERGNLAAVAAHCAGHGWPRHTTDLARTLFRYLMNGSYLTDARTIYGHALQAARLSGDLTAEAEALNGLGSIAGFKGQFQESAGHYQAALECYRRCGDKSGEARVLHNLGITEHELHNYQSAIGYFGQATAVYEDIGDSLGVSRTLVNLGAAETELGCYDEAAEHLQRALPLLRSANDDAGEAVALEGLGELSLRRGQLIQAAACFEQALSNCRRVGYPTGAADQLLNLGAVGLRLGQHQQAIGYIGQALAVYREIGNPYGEAHALRNLATAHRDLAENHHAAGEHEQARTHWQQALTLYTQLGAPEADEVESRLR